MPKKCTQSNSTLADTMRTTRRPGDPIGGWKQKFKAAPRARAYTLGWRGAAPILGPWGAWRRMSSPRGANLEFYWCCVLRQSICVSDVVGRTLKFHISLTLSNSPGRPSHGSGSVSGRFRWMDVGWIRSTPLKRMSNGSLHSFERPGS